MIKIDITDSTIDEMIFKRIDIADSKHNNNFLKVKRDEIFENVHNDMKDNVDIIFEEYIQNNSVIHDFVGIYAFTMSTLLKNIFNHFKIDKISLEKYFCDNHFKIDCNQKDFIQKTDKHEINLKEYFNNNMIQKIDEYIHYINKDDCKRAVLVAEQAQTDLLYLLTYITENTEFDIINALANL